MSSKRRRQIVPPPSRRPEPRKSRHFGLLGLLGGAIIALTLTVIFVLGQGATTARAVDISASQLHSELAAKDFTLLNVKTPYIGEIPGTDLYIPYDQLAARANELPKDKTALIVVYCHSGNESAIATRTLLSLGYTRIQNLSGGMDAWVASGGTIVQVAR